MFLIGEFLFAKNRSGEYSRNAYVTFKDAYALETAVLLSVSLSNPHSKGNLERIDFQDAFFTSAVSLLQVN